MRSSPVRSFIFLGCVIAVIAFSRPPHKGNSGQYLPPLLPRKELLHFLGASHQQLVADYFWIQTIQAVGRAFTRDEYLDVYYYADLVTDLDPYFILVYGFAAVAIPVNLGHETWVNTAESTRLLERGLKYAPHYVYLRILLAYNYSYFLKDYRRAAEVLAQTAQLPGAPKYVGPLATRLYAQSGQIEAGLTLAQSLYENAEDPETRKTFEHRIKELELERILRQLDDVIDAYTRRKGRAPSSMQELIANGDLHALPADPLGGELVIGTDGRIQSTARTRRLTVYEPRKD